MALTQGLIDSYWRRYNQRRALTGLPSSYQEQRGALDPMLDQAYRTDLAERARADELSYRNRALNLQENAQKSADRAATVSGVAQVGGLLSTGLLTNKALNNQAVNNDMMRQYLLRGAGSGGAPVIPGVGNGALPPPGTLQTPGYTPPILQTSTAFPAAEAGGAVAPTASAGSSMMSAAGPAAALYGAQYTTGRMMQPTLDKAGMSNAGTGFTYAGLPGASIGAVADIGSFAKDVFGF